MRRSSCCRCTEKTRVEQILKLQPTEGLMPEQVDISWRICNLWKVAQKQSYPEVLYGIDTTLRQGKSVRRKERHRGTVTYRPQTNSIPRCCPRQGEQSGVPCSEGNQLRLEKGVCRWGNVHLKYFVFASQISESVLAINNFPIIKSGLPNTVTRK